MRSWDGITALTTLLQGLTSRVNLPKHLSTTAKQTMVYLKPGTRKGEEHVTGRGCGQGWSTWPDVHIRLENVSQMGFDTTWGCACVYGPSKAPEGAVDTIAGNFCSKMILENSTFDWSWNSYFLKKLLSLKFPKEDWTTSVQSSFTNVVFKVLKEDWTTSGGSHVNCNMPFSNAVPIAEKCYTQVYPLFSTL